MLTPAPSADNTMIFFCVDIQNFPVAKWFKIVWVRAKELQLRLEQTCVVEAPALEQRRLRRQIMILEESFRRHYYYYY